MSCAIRLGPGAPRQAYILDVLGHEYVVEVCNITEERYRKLITRGVSAYFMAHYLAIADIYVAWRTAARAEGIQLTWLSELEAAYRYKLHHWEEHSLEPDAVILLSGLGLATTTIFLEVDRATESLQRWQSKVQAYIQYFLTREGFLGQWEIWPQRVLILVTAPNRARAELLKKETLRQWCVKTTDHSLLLGFVDHDAACSGDVLRAEWAELDGGTVRLLEASKPPVSTANCSVTGDAGEPAAVAS